MSDTKEKSKYKIKISTPDVGYEPFPVSIINRSASEAFTFDPSLGKPASIKYKLTKAGTIRLRIARRDDPEVLITTLMDWTDQPFGEHVVKWDGRDASGNIVDNKKVMVLFESKDGAGNVKHIEHDPSACFDPELTIKAAKDTAEPVRGEIEITASFSDRRDIRWDSGCEVSYFIDYKLLKKEVFKEEQKSFSIKINTAELENGDHFITVNTHDFNDHKGTASLKITASN